MLLFMFLFTCLISDSGGVCLETARTLNRMNTRSVNYTAMTLGNDMNLVEGWYSTMYNGLQYLIADSYHRPASTGKCGTEYPIYLRAVHPSLDLITEEPLVVRACSLYFSDGSCYQTPYVKIRKCNGQIQYYLSPSSGSDGYCFDPWNTILKTDASGELCNATPTALDRMDTRSVNYTETTSGSDAFLVEGWYSTMHNGMQYLIADRDHKPDSLGRCGTAYPFSIRGVHPSLDNLTEQPIEDVVCRWFELETCVFRTPIKIRKCNGQIQYYLHPTTWMPSLFTFLAGYCFDPWYRILTTNKSVDKIDIKTELKFRIEGLPSERQDITPYIMFRCDFKKVDELIYTVSWYVDGNLLITTGPSSNETDFLLHENTLLDFTAGSNLHGKQMSCSVSTHSTTDVNNIVSTAQSKLLKISAEVKTNPVLLHKNGVASLDIEFTLPIGCGYTIIENEKPSFPCDYSLKLYTKDGYSHAAGGIANIVTHPRPGSFCTEPIRMLEKSDQWNQTKFMFSLDIATIDHSYEDTNTYFLELKFDHLIAHKLWKNYTFPDVKVIVGDTKLYQQKFCYSRVDPHMKTADNSYYEQQRTGYFMLYYNSKYKVEVQQQVEVCSKTYNYPKCACGIAMRAGKDVFMINSCGGVNFMGFTSCGDGGIIDVRQIGTRQYSIFTPIGTQIKVQMLSDYYSGKLIFEIFRAPKDENNVEGQCGKFDGDYSNEFTHKGGGFTPNIQYYTQDPKSFSDSWRISDEQNLFLRPERELESWNDINKYYCICNRQEELLSCASSQNLRGMNENSLTQRKCLSLSRKRRSSNKRVEIEIIRLFPIFSKLRNERKKREIAYNISADEAARMCAVLNQSLPLTDLADISGNESAVAVISQCVYDVVEMNDPSFVNVHLDAMNGVVQTILDLTPSYVSNNTDKVNNFIANSCSMNCSGNGICMANGTCACTSTYRGSDCSIDITQPMAIDDIEGGGVCDIAEGDDCQCFTLRTNDLLDKFHCAIDVYQVTNNMDSEKLWSESNVGQYEDLFTGACCVNNKQQSRSKASFATMYGFTVSNDGVNYGAAIMTYVYDSTCQYVNRTPSGEVLLSMKDNYCLLDGLCVDKNQTNSADSCLVCYPETSAFSWQRVCDDTTADSTSGYNVVLVVVITSAAVIGVITLGLTIVLVWKFCLKKKVKPDSQPDEILAGIPAPSSQLPLANTAWSQLKYASNEFEQPEQAHPYLQPFEHSETLRGSEWTTISVSSNSSTIANKASISRKDPGVENSGLFKHNLKLKTEVAASPTNKKNLPRGVSIISLEFDFDCQNE